MTSHHSGKSPPELNSAIQRCTVLRAPGLSEGARLGYERLFFFLLTRSRSADCWLVGIQAGISMQGAEEPISRTVKRLIERSGGGQLS